MIDIDLQALSEQRPDHSLEQLESDVWAGVAIRVHERRLIRALAFCQMLVMLIAFAGSVVAGVALATKLVPAAPASLRAPDAHYAPSALLLGVEP